jgi:hypothetical protein
MTMEHCQMKKSISFFVEQMEDLESLPLLHRTLWRMGKVGQERWECGGITKFQD